MSSSQSRQLGKLLPDSTRSSSAYRPHYNSDLAPVPFWVAKNMPCYFPMGFASGLCAWEKLVLIQQFLAVAKPYRLALHDPFLTVLAETLNFFLTLPSCVSYASPAHRASVVHFLCHYQ